MNFNWVENLRENKSFFRVSFRGSFDGCRKVVGNSAISLGKRRLWMFRQLFSVYCWRSCRVGFFESSGCSLDKEFFVLFQYGNICFFGVFLGLFCFRLVFFVCFFVIWFKKSVIGLNIVCVFGMVFICWVIFLEKFFMQFIIGQRKYEVCVE